MDRIHSGSLSMLSILIGIFSIIFTQLFRDQSSIGREPWWFSLFLISFMIFLCSYCAWRTHKNLAKEKVDVIHNSRENILYCIVILTPSTFPFIAFVSLMAKHGQFP